MDGIAAITNRIAEIQSAIASLAPPAPVASVATAATTSVASTGPTGAAFSTAASSTAAGSADSFASVLATEVASQAGPAAGSGQLNAQGIPVELAAYGNGKIPSSALATISGTGARLWSPAARSYEELAAAAARDGVTMTITDSYRSFEAQVDVAKRKGLYSQGGLAAVPGTSDHGWGRSLDLGLDAKALGWMRAHAAEFGFKADVPRESWHWTYSPPSG